MGFASLMRMRKWVKLVETAAGMTAWRGTRFSGPVMHVGVANLVQAERTGQHDMMLD